MWTKLSYPILFLRQEREKGRSIEFNLICQSEGCRKCGGGIGAGKVGSLKTWLAAKTRASGKGEQPK